MLHTFATYKQFSCHKSHTKLTYNNKNLFSEDISISECFHPFLWRQSTFGEDKSLLLLSPRRDLSQHASSVPRCTSTPNKKGCNYISEKSTVEIYRPSLCPVRKPIRDNPKIFTKSEKMFLKSEKIFQIVMFFGNHR